jgi:hypothetical protein
METGRGGDAECFFSLEPLILISFLLLVPHTSTSTFTPIA